MSDTVNVFLNGKDRDIETAIMLENAVITDIGNAVAYTDGNRVFVNTDDNLYKILPAYSHDFLKWLLWHERYHMELRHHNRFFRYLTELDEKKTKDKFDLTKEEVNIIMDILVHDSLSKLFPELVDIATQNLAQMRNRNSLKYTFTTHTLEEMLDEYKKNKEEDAKDGDGEGEGESKDEEKEGEGKGEGDSKEDEDKEKDTDKKGKSTKKTHKEGGSEAPEPDDTDEAEDGDPKMNKDAKKPEHDKTDWSKLEEIDSKEFITKDEGDKYVYQIQKLRNMKLKMARLTETLNGLVTSTRRRTYSKPNPIKLSGGVILKGSRPGKASLYLCFDASGSMGEQLQIFKDIIAKSIPQAMEVPCEWFTGRYKKGKFKDIMPIHATNGFDDDGDRTIELCYKAEQQGYSPIGVTDGGGQISWSTDMLKQLRRTILVGQNPSWLEMAQAINPRIQIISI